MAAVTLPITAAGALVDALVDISPPRQRALAVAGKPIPAPVAVRALVDIGASCTFIDLWVVQALSLTPTGTSSILTAASGTTAHPCHRYDISLGVVMANQQTHSLPSVISAIDAGLAAHGFQLILGRDVLAHGRLFYDGKGQIFTLSF
ncbi:MAG: aspartyl protease family protein [Bradyrhizobium sp.]